MLLFGCLLAFGAAFAPRVILILAWIFGYRWDKVWDGNWFLPLLGIIIAPYTTIMYILVWSPSGLSGFDWVWLAMGVLLDVMKWSQIANNRKGIPGQGDDPAPAPAAQPAPVAKPVEKTELEQLADLHEKGILTDEEFEAKKAQLAG